MSNTHCCSGPFLAGFEEASKLFFNHLSSTTSHSSCSLILLLTVYTAASTVVAKQVYALCKSMSFEDERDSYDILVLQKMSKGDLFLSRHEPRFQF